MNKIKSSGLLRLIAFFLVAVIMVCTFGFAADGWSFSSQNENQNPDSTISGNLGDTEQKEENTDEGDKEKEPEIYIPEYVSSLTGLETTEELASKKPVSFVMDSSSPLYGVSHSEVLVELPVDNGATRLVAITTDLTNMWKIGSLAAGRGYILNVGKFFDSTVISSLSDDAISYESCDMTNESISFSQENGFCYSEYSYYLYTNVNLANSALIASQVNTVKKTDKQLPYVFTEFGNEEILGDKNASSVSIIYSSGANVELAFSTDEGEYRLMRNGNANKDLLNNEEVKFKNCFVLFADSVTYEGTNGSQTVMNTISEGVGFYFTNGTVQDIKWRSDIDGNLTFTDLNDLPLTVNRGKMYIGFIKSSRPENVSFS